MPRGLLTISVLVDAASQRQSYVMLASGVQTLTRATSRVQRDEFRACAHLASSCASCTPLFSISTASVPRKNFCVGDSAGQVWAACVVDSLASACVDREAIAALMGLPTLQLLPSLLRATHLCCIESDSAPLQWMITQGSNLKNSQLEAVA
jgi:hypothetical protein